MARSDLVIDLVEAQRRGDNSRFRMLVEAITPRKPPCSTMPAFQEDAGAYIVARTEIAANEVI